MADQDRIAPASPRHIVNGRAWCTHCEFEITFNASDKVVGRAARDVAAAKLAEHARNCDKHPLVRERTAQRDELLSALKGLLAAVSAIVAADEVKSLDGIVAALPEAKRASDDAIVAVARAEGASHGE